MTSAREQAGATLAEAGLENAGGRGAAHCPRLPARVLVPLLRDPETAEHAAQNAAIPPGVIRRMAERDRSGASPRG